MATNPSDHDPHSLPNKRNAGGMIVWLVAGCIATYISLFALICVDEFVMGQKMIWEPLQRNTPQFADQFRDFCRTIYFPLIELMKVTKVIP